MCFPSLWFPNPQPLSNTESLLDHIKASEAKNPKRKRKRKRGKKENMAVCLRTDKGARDLLLSVDNHEEKEGREVMA